MDAPEVRHSVPPICSSSDEPEMLSLMAFLPPIQVTNTNRYGVVTRYEEDHFGRKQGRFTEHNHKGEPLSECYYKDDKLHGQYTRWGCGEIHLVRERYNYTDGILDGLYEKFHHNGSIAKRMTYKSGHITGRIQTWDENGSVIEDWDYPLDIPF
jgi:antitoxin component YwqK of YwqJK toxin-antitoxin module